MRNPFEKSDHKPLIAGIVIGAVAAGAAAYLLLTEHGTGMRQKISGYLDKLLGKEPGPAPLKETPAYLQHKTKAPKTDREKLLKHEILHTPAAGENEHHE